MIRKAEEKDIDGILDVLAQYDFRVLNTEDGAVLDPEVGELLTLYNEVSALDLAHGFVVEENQRIVGFAHYKIIDKKTAKTTLMTVLPECRGKGWGKELQVARMREAFERGSETLLTYCELPKSIAWYRGHFGYVVLRQEATHHRLHYIPLVNRVIWGVHYGFKEKELSVMECDLAAYFEQKG